MLTDPGGGIKGGPPAWGSGYLPATFQGTTMRPGKNPILDLRPQPAIADFYLTNPIARASAVMAECSALARGKAAATAAE